MFRSLTIGIAVLGFAAHAGWARVSRRARASLPAHLRRSLESLGPPFVKLGQALSLRREQLPDDFVAALQGLQDRVVAFPGNQAREEIERALAKPMESVFAAFDEIPFAAASIAQVHRARLHDGHEVAVKVLRPAIRTRIDVDMRLLVAALRALGALIPAIRRFGAAGLAREIWARMRNEADLRREAANVRRFADAWRDQPLAYVPDVHEALCTETVMVQEFSHGRRIDDPALRPEGPRLARALIELYLQQLFVTGVFHGDPHPGNLFVTADGRLCFHDFGVVGELNPAMRRQLAVFMIALSTQDEQWLLDAAADLGLLGPRIDRRDAREEIGAILAEYAGRRLGDWSLGEALVRIMRLGRGTGFALPANLAVLARTAGLLERVLQQLDSRLTVVDALTGADPELLRGLLRPGVDRAATQRLKSEAAMAIRRLPTLVAQWLHRAQRESAGLPVFLRLDAAHDAFGPVYRSLDRLALGLVALGLYIASSLLMQHGAGPQLPGGVPLLAAAGYALALWFTFRIVRGIAAPQRGERSRAG